MERLSRRNESRCPPQLRQPPVKDTFSEGAWERRNTKPREWSGDVATETRSNRKCVLADQEELPPLFGRPVRLLFSGTNERGLLMKDTMDGALFWWMGALATGIVVAVAALMS